MTLKSDYRRHFTAPLLVLSVFILLRITGRIDTALLTRENEYLAVILLQITVFMLPAVIYMSLTGSNVTDLRLRPIGIGHLLLLISGVIVLSSGTLLIDGAGGDYEVLEQSYDLWGIFISKSSGSAGSTLYLLLAYAILPAVCEEFVFRSVLCREYETESLFASLFMPSLFFAMLHFDLSRFFSCLFSGLVLALTFYACRSVLASVTVHLCYNIFSLFGRNFMQTLYDLGGEKLFSFIVTMLFLLFAFIFCAEAARLYRNYSDRNLSSAYRKAPKPAADSNPLVPNAVSDFILRHPKFSATLACIFHPAALACYIFYIVAVLL